MIDKLLDPISNNASRFEARVKIGLLALLAFSVLATNLKELAGILLFGVDASMEEVSRHEERFAALRHALPPRGTVGFTTDETNRTEQGNRFQMARYALTPVVVVPGVNWPLVVGDFNDPAAARALAAKGLSVREDLGGGLLLLANPQR